MGKSRDNGDLGFRMEPVSNEVGNNIIDIFNYYIENSFAAYPERKIPYEFFQTILETTRGYPFLVAKDDNEKVLGFGMLRPHNPLSTFSRTAEITYFISPEHTRMGIGKKMQERLIDEAKKMGISSILASISSLNPRSLAFHKKNGFVECGRFVNIGRKNGRDFDVVWMQKML
jgi:L-amino acid N-acyltransferase YncA